eukprot:TRINITY_DN6615_c0_g3_i1.p1 TRINITY_DN6615_c0_g3~~TRINITY_DN6615_c0_g3_i1.p1  ORF type:complete len:366 (+),score=86.03 TRINITY_DN6615_c0_g3_i1:102-1199(+)
MSTKLSAVLNPIGLAILKHLCEKQSDSDVFISPLSISACLKMVHAGATENSPADQEMKQLLGEVAPILPENSSIEMANSAWVRAAIKEEYLETLKNHFSNAEVAPLPSTDPKPINDWVSTRTKGKITSLFDEPLDPLTVLVLINTVFFKGTWSEPFDPTLTRQKPFKAGDGSSISCDMMYRKDKRMQYTEDELFQAVRLQYTGDMSATILLPQEEGPVALNKLIQSLTPERLESLHDELESQACHVELEMPRFKVEFGEQLADCLKELGMPSPFDKNEGFLKMSDDPLVHIGAVVHKATAEINEEGTVASAATAAVMMTRSMPPPSIPMVVDRPFIFVITDAEGGLIFIGRISKPTLSGIGAKLS